MSEEFELELSSFSNRINVFCLLIWRYLNVKSSLSRTDGSEGKVYKKVTVANLALCEKNGRSNPALGGAFLHSFGLGGGNLNEPILKRSNARRVTRKGMQKLQIDDALFMNCSITISNCKHDTFIIPVIITEVGSLINNYIRESCQSFDYNGLMNFTPRFYRRQTWHIWACILHGWRCSYCSFVYSMDTVLS